MNPVVQEIISQLKSYNAEKIILFGSYVSGNPTEDSDIDLLLIKETPDSFLERQKKIRTLLDTTTAVDIFVFTPEEFEQARMTNLFVKEAVRTGKIIYEQS